ncbi:ADP-ribosylglycohydrolase family protein [Macellibacteroides fermentans]|uniref:ADP-ribosylglycohydrolase family protein n=1 Tax=Macellibacteroides fermentans TaxID=879969 RepID=UPI00406C0F92
MLGAIIGDVIGSRFELNNTHEIDFELFSEDCSFTDDTVLTVAISKALVYETEFAIKIKEYALKYPNAGYGKMFKNWLYDKNEIKGNSYGNGSAMRISSIALAFDNLDIVLKKIEESCLMTHNHIDAIRGAKAIGSCIFHARNNKSKKYIKTYIEEHFHYNLDFTLDSIRGIYKFDSSCNGSVPQSIVSFLESKDFIHAIRLAISIGGDSDTIAAMTGSIAEAYYKAIPEEIICQCFERLTFDLKDDILGYYIKYPNFLSEKEIEYFSLNVLSAEKLIEGKNDNYKVVEKSLIGIIDDKGEKVIYNDGTKLPSTEPYNNRYYEKNAVLIRRCNDSKTFIVIVGGGYIERTSLCWPPFELERPIFIECSDKLFHSLFPIKV